MAPNVAAERESFGSVGVIVRFCQATQTMSGFFLVCPQGRLVYEGPGRVGGHCFSSLRLAGQASRGPKWFVQVMAKKTDGSRDARASAGCLPHSVGTCADAREGFVCMYDS